MAGSEQQRKSYELRLSYAVVALTSSAPCHERIIHAYKHLVFIEPSIFGNAGKDLARVVAAMSTAIERHVAGIGEALAPAVCEFFTDELLMFAWNLESFRAEKYSDAEPAEQ